MSKSTATRDSKYPYARTKVTFEVRRIDMVQHRGAKPPTSLTASYKSCLPWSVLRTSLSLQPVTDGTERGLHAERIQLYQKFHEGEGPLFTVTSGSKLVFTVYTGSRVRTRAEIKVNYLLSYTKEHPAFVFFEAKDSGKEVVEGYLAVVQVNPDPTPRLPAVRAFRFTYYAHASPVHHYFIAPRLQTDETTERQAASVSRPSRH